MAKALVSVSFDFLIRLILAIAAILIIFVLLSRFTGPKQVSGDSVPWLLTTVPLLIRNIRSGKQ